MIDTTPFPAQFRSRPGKAPRSARHGLSSVLAMLFLVLFATLAVGVVAATTMSAQISRNDNSLSQARASAEGGMQFIRYQLDSIQVPPLTPQSGLLSAVAVQLGTILNGTANMSFNDTPSTSAKTVQVSNNTITLCGTVYNSEIYVPSATDWIVLDANAQTKFRAIITQSGTNLVVTITGGGSNASITKGIELQYQQAQLAGAIFNYGVASKGEISSSAPLTVKGATDFTKGSVLVASADSIAISNSGNGSSISGDLSYTNSAAVNSYGNMTVDGYSSTSANFSQHVHAGVAAPQFPTIDSSVFLPYVAGNIYSGSTSASNPPPFVNCILPAGGNYNFSGNITIQGVLYIMQPNKVSFSGPVTLQGAIVVDTTNPPSGTDSTNQIKFSQTVTATGIDTLPSSSTFPDSERALTGSVILAPNFSVIGTNSFGTVSGSLIAGAWSFSNTFTANVYGSLIQLDDTPMKFTNTSTVTIQSTGTSYFPAGVTFGTKYVPLPGTYLEP